MPSTSSRLARSKPAILGLGGWLLATSCALARSKLTEGRMLTWARTGKVSRGPWASTTEPLVKALAGLKGNTSGWYSFHQQTGCLGNTGTTSGGWRVLGV
ncbi:hypothetical protein FB45DRAFT_886709 [Roridomyces roridus]|uniref:Uncharacterized protein n=1 Tax=Roridomyces roridus TaxID=1738132 RepID=A0AAD7CIM3_9AGAR|nr:hypothetical protein FB45DRAFT_886709 [Roridomyces roridus]